MTKNHWIQITLLALLLTAVVFFGIALVVSLDRFRFELEDLKGSIRDLQDNIGLVPAPDPDGPKRTAAVPGPNSEYFDRAAQSGGRMITAIASDAGNLNPVVSNDATVSELWSLANASLTERNYGDLQKFEPALAESWSVSDDKMTYHIKLRPNLFWHDFTDPVTGKEWKNVPVTAEDFKFYVDVIKNEAVDAAPLRGYLSGIQTLRVLSENEFEIVWNKKYFLAKDISLGLMPLPRHLYHAYDGPFDPVKFNTDSARNGIIVGCGPYQLVRWEKGKRFLFKRYERYFGRTCGVMPPLRQYAFEIVQHPSTRLQALQAGNIDQTPLSPEQWINNTSGPEFQDGGALKKLKYPSHSYNYIGLNLTNPLFQDRRVRVALSSLIDRKRLLTDVYRGLARATSGPVFMDGPGYDTSIQPYAFDPEKAKRLLAEAGWKDTDGDGILDKDGKKFQFTLMFPSANPNYPRIVPILKEDMAKAGVCLEVLALEWSVVIQRIEKRNFEAAMLGWTTSSGDSDPYQLWHSDNARSAASSNFISFSNPEADKLIDAIRASFDEKERQELYWRFHRLIHEEQPYLFLFSPYSLMAMDARYRNLRIFPNGVPDALLWTPRAEQKAVPGL